MEMQTRINDLFFPNDYLDQETILIIFPTFQEFIVTLWYKILQPGPEHSTVKLSIISLIGKLKGTG